MSAAAANRSARREPNPWRRSPTYDEEGERSTNRFGKTKDEDGREDGKTIAILDLTKPRPWCFG
jgi:hypothetical protein